MHSAIADKREELTEICRHYDVARLEIFGSAARGVDFDPLTSDADFLVEFQTDSSHSPFDQFFGFADALRKVLGRPVDLVESCAIKNPVRRANIKRSCELIFAS